MSETSLSDTYAQPTTCCLCGCTTARRTSSTSILVSTYCELLDPSSALENGLVTYEEREALLDLSKGMRWFKYISWAYRHVEELEERLNIHAGEIKQEILSIREQMNSVAKLGDSLIKL